jgi:hypothetical protein
MCQRKYHQKYSYGSVPWKAEIYKIVIKVPNHRNTDRHNEELNDILYSKQNLMMLMLNGKPEKVIASLGSSMWNSKNHTSH